MAYSLQVVYPASEGTRFDFDYYLATHMPMVEQHLGPHIDRTLVTKGLASGPDAPPAFHAVTTMVFADKAAMDAAMGAAEPLLQDIPNFTDCEPQMLVGEVVLE